MRLTVKENTSLERDQGSNAILSNDSASYNAALIRKKYHSNASKEVANLKDEISELKDLVKTLIVKMNK
jgi:lipopolysaccharide export system protein LptC|tara:strand:- start:259 stop:465 length:207 start_codon:yes stop_codon:yes gene_type:complete